MGKTFKDNKYRKHSDRPKKSKHQKNGQQNQQAEPEEYYYGVEDGRRYAS